MNFWKNKYSNEVVVLLVSVFLIALCGIVYELSIGNISTYLLGNGVLQYSLTIGSFMFAMGIGSFLSRYINKNLMDAFILVETGVGFMGGFSALILFSAYAFTPIYSAAMFTVILIIGVLVGLEIPILTRLIEEKYRDIKVSISNALGFDYIGALIGSIAFSMFMLPRLGIIRSSYILGLVNLFVVIINIKVFYKDIVKKKLIVALSVTVTLGLAVGLAQVTDTENFLEQKFYADRIIYRQQSPYQKIVMTQKKQDLRLFIDGNLQFSSIDEYRYHECLVHPAMSLMKNRENILVLGGGDGLAVREVLKYPQVKKVTLVDLDEAMTDLGMNNPRLLELNKGSLKDPRVHIVNQDAYQFLENSNELYSLIVVDLPDPNNESLSKLYTKTFYEIIKRHLIKGGFAVIQSTSPYFAPDVYWCIRKTVESTGLETSGYHTDIPSFGDWGFTIASNTGFSVEDINIDVETRFLSNEQVKALFVFAKDLKRPEVRINTITSPVITDYYEKSWKYWQ